MIKLVYKPLGMLVSVLGGILAGAIFKKVNGSWRRGVPAKLGRRGCAGGHGPAFAATGVLPVRRPAP